MVEQHQNMSTKKHRNIWWKVAIVVIVVFLVLLFLWLPSKPTDQGEQTAVDLRWIMDNVDVTGSTLMPGKLLYSDAIHYDTYPPERFKIYRMPARWEHLLFNIDSEEYITGSDVNTIREGVVRSVEPFRLPEPGPYFFSRYFFRDSDGNSSRHVIASEFVWSEFEIPDLDDHYPLKEITTGLIELVIGLFAARDPDLVLSVVTPWGEGNDNIVSYLVQWLAQDPQFDEEMAENHVREMLGPFLSEEPPAEWSFEFSQDTIRALMPEEPQQTELRITAPTPGEFILAIRVTDLENPDVWSISDVIIIRSTL